MLVSLNCNGSEDHLKNCPHRDFMKDVNCYTIATAVCKGMWKHVQVRHRARPIEYAKPVLDIHRIEVPKSI